MNKATGNAVAVSAFVLVVSGLAWFALVADPEVESTVDVVSTVLIGVGAVVVAAALVLFLRQRR